MTPRNLKRYLPLLKLLTKNNLTRNCFATIIRSLDDQSVEFLCECIHNGISINHISKLDKKQKSKLIKNCYLTKE